jgi:hypothetical protein
VVDINALQEDMRQRVEAFRDEIHGMIAQLAGVPAAPLDEPTPTVPPVAEPTPDADVAESGPA